MVSRLQVKAARKGREIVDVTPQSAGWEHVGFRAIRLEAGESERIDTGTRELCLVVLDRHGRCDHRRADLACSGYARQRVRRLLRPPPSTCHRAMW